FFLGDRSLRHRPITVIAFRSGSHTLDGPFPADLPSWKDFFQFSRTFPMEGRWRTPAQSARPTTPPWSGGRCPPEPRGSPAARSPRGSGTTAPPPFRPG